MATQRTPEALMDQVRAFRQACVIIAATELDVFTLLDKQPLGATALAGRLKADPRALAVLLDALAAMELLTKRDGRYQVPADVADVLTETGAHCMLGMAQHLGNCLRRWGQLAEVVMTGRPAAREPSVRGADGDTASFIRAMHEISAPVAAGLIGSLGPLGFSHVLDLGGASGSWTIPLLRLNPGSKATIFDLPGVIPMAADLMKKVGLSDRVRLVAGDFYDDALPAGADMAWVSAIVHQNSREENRTLFGKIFAALVPGGRILIRDIVMDEARTRPVMGALFAVNMLVATSGGGTFTFNELREDLADAGFVDARLLLAGEAIDSVVAATKPR